MEKSFQVRFDGIIGKVAKQQGELNGSIHTANVLAIGHAMFHGDVSLGNRLIAATKGSDRKAIAIYLTKFGPFKATNDGFKLNKKFRDEHQFDEQKLLDGVQWYEFVPSAKQVMQSFDLAKKVESLLKSAQDKLAEGKDVENAALMDYLAKAVKSYNGDKAAALRRLGETMPEGQIAPAVTVTPAPFVGQAPVVVADLAMAA